ncbi:hypothetical protein P3S68_032577 [Capsicum galapagoense]
MSCGLLLVFVLGLFMAFTMKLSTPNYTISDGGSVRPKKYWRKAIRHDAEQLQLIVDMTLERKVWRTQIRIEG